MENWILKLLLVPEIILGLLMIVLWVQGLVEEIVDKYLKHKQMRSDFIMFKIHYDDFMQYKECWKEFIDWKLNKKE